MRKLIEKIKIENFKSIKSLELEFSKINIFIGPNASGKSNIIDAFIFLDQGLDSYSKYGKKNRICWKIQELWKL